MYLPLRRLSLTGFLLVNFYFLSAQINSPYSRYGLGNIFPTTFDAANGMGGISATYFTPTNINYLNPASYADLNYAIFDVGGFANVLTIETVDDRYTSGDGNLSHMAYGFPFLKKLRNQRFGLSFGLIPYSSFQYNIFEDIPSEDPQLGVSEYNYVGKGDLYQFYGGLGYRVQTKPHADTSAAGDISELTHGFSLGLNAAYLFGGLSSITYASFPDQVNSQTTKLERENRVGGIIYNFGIGYELQKVKNKKEYKDYLIWRIGGSMNPNINVDGLQSVLWTNILKNGNYEFTTDTLYAAPDTSGQITLPLSFRAGVSFSFFSTSTDKNQYTISAEYANTKWNNYNGFQSTGVLKDNWRATLGTEFIPKSGDSKKQTLSYRFGLFTGTSYLEINGEQLKEQGLSFGFGIPIGVGKQPFSQDLRYSKINFSATIGTRGNTDLIKETFYNFGIGFNLVDMGWFRKYRLN